MATALKNNTKRHLRHLLTRFLDSPIPTRSPFATASSLQTLAYEELRSPSSSPAVSPATVFVLHGLLGTGRNWRSFSRNLASALSLSSPPSEWRMILVDLRNHGKSAEIEGLEPPHDMFSAAKDLSELVKSEGWDWPDVVMGHSMGGKVALQFAESCTRGHYGESSVCPRLDKSTGLDDNMILGLFFSYSFECSRDTFSWSSDAEQLWVLDSVPGQAFRSDGEVEKVLQTLQNLPSTVPSRKWLVNHMQKLGFSRSLSDWIGSNLKKSGDHETWSFNLEGAIQMFHSYRETSYWSLLEEPPKGTEISVLRAENSDRWDQGVVERLESLAGGATDSSSGKVSYHILPNCGHWVHVDNPKGLLDLVTPTFASLKPR